MRRVKGFVLAIASSLAIAASPPGTAACKGAECDRESPWRKMSAVTLRLTEPDALWLDLFRAEFDHAKGDVAIELDLRRPEGQARGTVAMVGGRVMLARGMPLEPGREIEAVDWPLLHIQLAMIVLGRVVPGGPDALKGERRIDHAGKAPIDYRTPSASGRIAMPWHVRGSVAKLPTGAVAYDLSITAPAAEGPAGATTKLQLQGEMSMLGREVFPDEAPLAGWSVYSVGPRVEKKGSSAAMDFGATPEARPFGTIKEVRAFIEERRRALQKRPR